jgi:hypothetical protein
MHELIKSLWIQLESLWKKEPDMREVEFIEHQIYDKIKILVQFNQSKKIIEELERIIPQDFLYSVIFHNIMKSLGLVSN